MSMFPYRFAGRFFTGALFLAALARGQVVYTGSSSGSDTWGIDNNWNSFSVPTAGDSVEFGNFFGAAPTIGANSYSVAQILFTSGSDVTIDGTGTLTVATGISSNINNSGTPINYTINPALALGGASAAVFNLGNDTTLTLNGAVSGTQGLTKSGGGTLTLNAGNTYSGTTTINGGTVVANTTGPAFAINGAVVINNGGSLEQAGSLSLGTSTAVTVNPGGSLNLGSGNTKIAAVTLAGGNVTGSGTASRLVTGGITVAASTSSVWNTTLALGASIGSANTTINVGTSGALNIRGEISDGALVKTGSGTLTLSSNNSYAGGTTINGGKIILNNSTSYGNATVLGTGNVTLNGGTLGVTAPVDLSGHTFTLGSGGGTFEAESTGFSIGTVISGAGALTKTGTDTLTLSAVNAYGGATTVSAGTLALGFNGALPANSALTVASGATFQPGSNDANLSSIAGAGNILITAGTTLTVGSSGTSTTFSGNLTTNGGGHLIKTGAGTLTLSGSARHGGNTTVNAGTLVLSGSLTGQFGGTTSGNIVVNGGTLELNNTSKFINGNVTLTSGTLQNGTLSAVAGYAVESGTVNVTIGNSSPLTKSTAGTVTLLTSNPNLGATTVNAGTLTLGSSATLGTGAGLTVNGGALNLGGTAQSFGAVTLAGGTVNLGGGSYTAGAVTLSGGALANGTVSGSSYAAQSGNITASLGGTGALTKTTAGTFILSGANTYTGATAVNAGTLQLGANNAIADTSAVSTASGAVLDVNGKTDTVGTLTNAGTLSLSGGALTVTTLAGTGNITLGGGTLAADSVSSTPTITLGGGTMTVGGTSATSTFNATLSGSGNFIKTGSGTVTLGANPSSFNGNTSINGGTLALPGFTAVGGPIAINSGGTLLLNSSDYRTYSNAISGAGTMSLQGPGGSEFTLTGPITMTGTISGSNFLIFDNASNYTLPATLNLTGGIGKTSNGTLTLSGTTTVSGGNAAGSLYIVGGTVVIGNGGTTGAVNGTIHLDAFTTLKFNRSDDITHSAAIAGNVGNIVKSGTNTVTLANVSTTGTTTVEGGSLVFSGANNARGDFALSGGNVSFTSGGTAATITGNVTGTGGLTLGAGTSLTISQNATYSGATVLGSGSTLTLSKSSSFTFASDVSGAGALRFTGGGTVTATGNLATSGLITVGGTNNLVVGDGGTSGSLSSDVSIGSRRLEFARSDNITVGSNISVGGGNLVHSGSGGLTLTGNVSNSSSSFTINVSNSGLLTLAGGLTGNFTKTGTGAMLLTTDFVGTPTVTGGTLRIGNGGTSGSVSGDIALGGGSVRFDRSDAITFGGAITGAGSLVKAGAGTLTLSGANTYSAGTTVSGGTLVIGADSALGGSSGSLTVLNSTLRFTSSFSLGPRAVSFGATNGTFDVDAGVTTTIGQQVSGNTLTKTGEGTLVLGYLHPELILAGGVVQLNPVTGASFSPVTFAGGTLKAGGSIGTTQSVTLTSTGTVNTNGFNVTFQGNVSGPGGLVKIGSGTLTLMQPLSGTNNYSGGTTINAGTLELQSTNSLPAAGALTLGGGTLAALGFTPSSTLGTLALSASSTIDFGNGASLLSFANSSATGWTGTLTLLNYTSGSDSLRFGTDGSGLTLAQLSQINFGAGLSAAIDGSGFVTASAIPEPGTYAAIAGAGVFCAVLWRRRRREGGSANPARGKFRAFLRPDRVLFAALLFLVAIRCIGQTVYTTDTTFNTAYIPFDAVITNNATVTLASASEAGSNTDQIRVGGDTTTAGTGTLVISGGSVLWGVMTIGPLAGSQGAVTVTDSNSLLQTFGELKVGSAGTGSLTASNGGQVQSSDIVVGETAGAQGAITVTGSGSSVSGVYLTLGVIGTGSLSISNGGVVSVTNADLGLNTGSMGTATVSGSGSLWEIYDGLSIGYFGSGVVTVSNGGKISVGSGMISMNGQGGANSSVLNIGAAQASAAAAAGVIDAEFVVGFNSPATLQFNTTGTALAPAYFTRDGTSTGAGVTTDGVLALIHTAGTTVIKGTLAHAGGTTINGGTLRVDGNFFNSGSAIAINSGGALQLGDTNSIPASAISLAGGTLATGGFNQTLGALTLSASSTIDFGSGTSALAFANSSAAGWTGTLTLLNYTSGTDTLRFGTNGSGLTAGQLSQINFGAGLSAVIDGSGFVTATAIPEPSTYAAIAGLATLGLAGWRNRSRRQKPAEAERAD